jgi:undecaprenyl-diphosphatase
MNWDLALFHAVNGWAGTLTLDRIAAFEEGADLLKGGLFMGAYWFFWFLDGPRREENRHTIVAVVLGSFLAVLANRLVSLLVPFRLRPMYDAASGWIPPQIPIEYNLEHWNAFPSDNGSFFGALIFGLWFLSRPAAILGAVFTAVWIWAPRVYLGIHYPSDIIVGVLIGIAAVAFSLRFGGSALGGPLLAVERRHAAFFYCGFFLLSFEMAVVFQDVRAVGRGIAHRLMDHPSAFELAAIVAVAAALALFGAAALRLTWRAWSLERTERAAAHAARYRTSAD